MQYVVRHALGEHHVAVDARLGVRDDRAPAEVVGEVGVDLGLGELLAAAARSVALQPLDAGGVDGEVRVGRQKAQRLLDMRVVRPVVVGVENAEERRVGDGVCAHNVAEQLEVPVAAKHGDDAWMGRLVPGDYI